MMTSVMEILENIMGKVENAGLPAFSTFPKMFSKAFLPEYPPQKKKSDCVAEYLSENKQGKTRTNYLVVYN